MALSVSLSIDNDLSLGLTTESELSIGLVADTVQVHGGEEYAGPYVVTPTLTGFDLETNDKYMSDDVTVNPIPINSAGNPQGGYTVVIG